MPLFTVSMCSTFIYFCRVSVKHSKWSAGPACRISELGSPFLVKQLNYAQEFVLNMNTFQHMKFAPPVSRYFLQDVCVAM